ncbi:alanine:cation symporter family protein, partial [Salmonella enterica subsp. enterica serovar Reading]|nr:alanine:cation symporter family protein [Salmonella enterica subsp. enterica serovar Reading]
TDASYQGIQIIFAALKETWHPIIVQVLCLGVALILFTSYLGSGVVVLNIEAIPQVIKSIFYYAFAPAPAAGGFVGSTIMMAIS